mmetsp:Transcript_35185/g.111888  ORF Transcript_35185/g.111888 Transcript_35185/m.111888 type:complete len:92 (-) Transcript_35185:89-364(-)
MARSEIQVPGTPSHRGSLGSTVGSKLDAFVPNRRRRSTKEVARGSDIFLVGLFGALLMAVQVFVGLMVLNSWLRKENKEMLEALAAAGIST